MLTKNAPENFPRYASEMTIEEKLESWGKGPWVSEPNYKELGDEHTMGVVRRVAHRESNGTVLWGGQLCGYVRIPDGHPWHGLELDDLDDKLSSHQGLTYLETNELGERWVGFDCAHLYDVIPSVAMVMKPFAYERSGTEMLKPEYRDFDYCCDIVRTMMDELEEAATESVK